MSSRKHVSFVWFRAVEILVAHFTVVLTAASTIIFCLTISENEKKNTKFTSEIWCITLTFAQQCVELRTSRFLCIFNVLIAWATMHTKKGYSMFCMCGIICTGRKILLQKGFHFPMAKCLLYNYAQLSKHWYVLFFVDYESSEQVKSEDSCLSDRTTSCACKF